MKWTTVLPLNDRHIMREPGTAPRPLSGRASGSVRFPHPRPRVISCPSFVLNYNRVK
nr:hypothetical protein Q903MT_gene6286 [Picea sitchensis]